MPPKRKSTGEGDANKQPKAKRQKIIEKDPSTVDSGFHNINLDITKKILDNLKLDMNDLKALSRTCSSWYNRIAQYYREKVVYITPFSADKYTPGEKARNLKEIGNAKKFVCDIQALDFNTDMPFSSFDAKVIPWSPNIVVLNNGRGVCVIDLRQPDPLFVVEHPPTHKSSHRAPLVIINSHRKQLLVTKKAYYKHPNHQTMIYGPRPTAIDSHPSVLMLYNVSVDGKVELASKITTTWYCSPVAGLMLDDGAIWLTGDYTVEIFREKSSKIYPHDFVDDGSGPFQGPAREVMGIIEHNGIVKFVVKDMTAGDEEPLTIQLFDTKTKQYTELPLDCDFDEYPKVEYTHGSLKLWDDGTLLCSCTLDPIRLQKNWKISSDDGEIESDAEASPDGSRLLEYMEDEGDLLVKLKVRTNKGEKEGYRTIAQAVVSFHIIEPDPTAPEKKKKRKKKSVLYKTGKQKKAALKQEEIGITTRSLGFFWLSNDIIIVTHENRIAILDFRYEVPAEGFKLFEMPLLERKKERFSPSDLARINDTSFLVFLQRSDDLRAYKITL